MPAATRTVERTTVIPGRRELVFALVMSPETAPLIDPSVRAWIADARPIAVGTRFSIRGRLGVVPIRGTSEVVTWDPPALAEFRSISPAWPFSMTARHQFGADGDDSTTYTWSVSFHPVSVLARPCLAIGARLFGSALDSQAAALTTYVRTHRADPPPSL